MIAARRFASVASRHYVTAPRTAASSQVSAHQPTARFSHPQLSSISLSPWHVSSCSSPTLYRPIHTSRILQQEAARKTDPEEAVKDTPRQEGESGEKAEAKSDETKSEQTDSGKEGESKKQDKKDTAPPPPHGDKTPWQVFTDTFRSGLKESKEWNESTKLLQGEVQEFKESEGVKKAGAAYEATVGRGTKVAGEALKGTARVVGHGAEWTWNTTGVQAVRKGVNAAGRGVEQATRPVRESQAFKNIQEAVDEGNSSRYGGWTEKEERRQRRAARAAKEGIRPVENMEENPEYVTEDLTCIMLTL